VRPSSAKPLMGIASLILGVRILAHAVLSHEVILLAFLLFGKILLSTDFTIDMGSR
jgi:hypothetical protein